jgi:hypothetical protein
VEKITDAHIRCRCSVPCSRYIATCETGGARTDMVHPHWMPRRKVGSAVDKATASRHNAQTDNEKDARNALDDRSEATADAALSPQQHAAL